MNEDRGLCRVDFNLLFLCDELAKERGATLDPTLLMVAVP